MIPSTLLVCVFAVSPGNPGVEKSKVLNPSESVQVARSAFQDDGGRSVRSKLCWRAFGKSPDLSWTEELAEGGEK